MTKRGIPWTGKAFLLLFPIACFMWLKAFNLSHMVIMNDSSADLWDFLAVSSPSTLSVYRPDVSNIHDRLPSGLSNHSTYCIQYRGISGNWYVNETMANLTFYKYGLRAIQWQNKKQKGEIQDTVYHGNKFAWNDTTTATHGCAPIQPLTKEFFCQTVEALKIKRILFVGDSLQINQLESMVGLMGYHPAELIQSVRPKLKRPPSFLESIECPVYGKVFVHERRENLGPNIDPADVSKRSDGSSENIMHLGPEIPYCVDDLKVLRKNLSRESMDGEFCPWHTLYNSSNEKTLLVMNQGAHFHSFETFSRSMEQFVSLFNRVAHEDDIVVFRTTVPGHLNCFEEGLDPNEMTHDRFLERYGTTMYDWNFFDEYNAIAKEKLTHLEKVSTHYLNVYNITVLRPDNHNRANDCLHYMPVGPVDFWNHLLFTNLAEMAGIIS